MGKLTNSSNSEPIVNHSEKMVNVQNSKSLNLKLTKVNQFPQGVPSKHTLYRPSRKNAKLVNLVNYLICVGFQSFAHGGQK